MTLEDIGPDNWRHCATLEGEMTLLIHPLVVGQGTCLISDAVLAGVATIRVQAKCRNAEVLGTAVTPTGALPFTGSDVGRTFGIGLAAVVVGGAAVWGARRSRASRAA